MLACARGGRHRLPPWWLLAWSIENFPTRLTNLGLDVWWRFVQKARAFHSKRQFLLVVKTRTLLFFALLCAAIAGLQSVHAATVANTAESGVGPLHQVLAAATKGKRSTPSAAAKEINARKSAGVEFSASRQRVGGREVAGFSGPQERAAQEENLTPPAGLKPVEQEAWLAVARRQGASGGMEFTSFYPAHYGEPFVVEGEGVRVAVRPLGGTDAAAQIANDQVIYREAYPETDSLHVVSAGRSEEFLFLQDECAPREFAYEISELSAGTHVELVKGEVFFRNKGGHGVK